MRNRDWLILLVAVLVAAFLAGGAIGAHYVLPLPGFWLLTADSGQVYQGQATIRASGVTIESDGARYTLPWKQVWGLMRPEPQTGPKAPLPGEPSN